MDTLYSQQTNIQIGPNKCCFQYVFCRTGDKGHLNSRMLYEHYLIKPHDNPVRETWKLKDWFNLCVGCPIRSYIHQAKPHMLRPRWNESGGDPQTGRPNRNSVNSSFYFSFPIGIARKCGLGKDAENTAVGIHMSPLRRCTV